jgi:hypothetical protein
MRYLGRKPEWDDIIKMNLKVCVNWIHLAQDRVQ